MAIGDFHKTIFWLDVHAAHGLTLKESEQALKEVGVEVTLRESNGILHVNRLDNIGSFSLHRDRIKSMAARIEWKD